MSFVLLVVLYTFPDNVTITKDYADEVGCIRDMQMIKKEFEDRVDVKCLPLINAVVVDGAA